MDQDIREALGDIKQTMRDGFQGTNHRISELVTQGEFRATVERIDTQHTVLRKEFDNHIDSVPARDRLALERDNAVDAAAEARDNAIRQEYRADLEGFRSTTRWAIGIAATAASVLVGAVFSIVNLFLK